MATYNKRGYKAPKPADINEIETEETFKGQSTTEGVFNTLDETASKTEAWVAKNQKIIFGIVGLIAVVTIGYLLYGKFILEPKEDEAATEMFQAQQYFTQAVEGNGTANDSLFNLSVNGGEGKLGFLGIIENYSGTDAANIAHYFAGMAYLNTGKYKEAVDHLENFSSNDKILSAMAYGATGDAFAQLNKNEDALEFYVKAAKTGEDDLTTPRFLLKAGQTALLINKKEDAAKYFTEIKEKFDTAPEARNIDAYIAIAQ